MYYGALEAGGTKMVCAIGDENKNIIDRISIPTDTPDQSVPVMIDYFKKHNISALGIGTFGPANVNQNSASYGVILKSPKKAWEGFNFYRTFTDALKCLVVVDTDVNAAAWGEFLFGALNGLHSGMYLTIGTGIGGGVIVDGHLVHGMMHPETGHILIPRRDGDDMPCTCRFHQSCAEGLAAGPMLERRTGMNGKDIPADSPVWDLEAYYIAEALVNYTMCYSVERIVLGGGVMDNDFLFPMIRKYYTELIAGYIDMPQVKDPDTYIVPAQLGGKQGIIGAMNLF